MTHNCVSGTRRCISLPAAKWFGALAILLWLFPHRASIQMQPLANDAYIWQREWTPAVDDAVRRAAGLIRAWRVLAGEAGPGGAWRTISFDVQVLRQTERPLIAVFRVGDGNGLEPAATIAFVQQSLRTVRQSGVTVAQIEFDYDCPVSQLGRYAEFLVKVRAALPERIAITALPAWLASPDAGQVFAQVDEIILQVHAVQSPRRGLFDRADARRWIDQLSARTDKAFRVALPTYGVRVSWRSDGSLLAVESETPLLAGGASSAELMASPEDVSALVRSLTSHPPPHLAGLVWFRLPVDSDRRAWSFATWRAVMQGSVLTAAVAARVRRSTTPGMSDLLLVNAGEVDARLPRAIELPRECAIGDGVNGYRLDPESMPLTLTRMQDGLLRGGSQQVAGWMRCAPEPEEIHVVP